jgi:chemotaxis protein methyltransferase CheR
MGKRMPDNLIDAFSRFVEVNMGLSFPKERRSDLEKGLHAVCEQFGYDDQEAFARHLMPFGVSKRHIEMLAVGLTIGETYFFREKNALDAFEHIVLSEAIRTRRGAARNLRIWSAGCAGGEEPYTIAMMLKMLLPDLKGWNITLLATDINPHFLEKAVKGVYTRWSFRDVPERIINRFFIKKGSEFEILPEIKEMVTFSYHNLMKGDYPSLLNNTNAMDVIFCRNVLMYFSPETIKIVARNFHRCLTDGGRLIVSQTELNDEYFMGYEKASHAGAMLFKKSDVKADARAYIPEFTMQTTPRVAEIRPSAIGNKTGMAYTPTIKEAGPVVAAEAIYESAGKAFEQGEYNRTEEILRILLQGSPDNTGALSLLARVCANQGRLDDAIRYIEAAIQTDNMNPGRHYLHAAILKEKGLKQEAMAALKKVVYLDADFAPAHFAMGNLAHGAGNRVEADRYFNNALLLLRKLGYDDMLPEFEGMTAGRLTDLIEQRTAGVGN